MPLKSCFLLKHLLSVEVMCLSLAEMHLPKFLFTAFIHRSFLDTCEFFRLSKSFLSVSVVCGIYLAETDSQSGQLWCILNKKFRARMSNIFLLLSHVWSKQKVLSWCLFPMSTSDQSTNFIHLFCVSHPVVWIWMHLPLDIVLLSLLEH